jgi:hypothetical protein
MSSMPILARLFCWISSRSTSGRGTEGARATSGYLLLVENSFHVLARVTTKTGARHELNSSLVHFAAVGSSSPTRSFPEKLATT